MIKNIENAVRTAAELLINQSGNKGIEVKTSRHDLVTMYDKLVQEKLYAELSAAYPKAGFLGEEGLQTPALGSGIFIIDPIDGTTNFVKGFNHSAISVGYCESGQMQYGVIYDPYKDEMFTAAKGCGAYLNGDPIHVSSCTIDKSVAHYGTSPYIAELTDKSFRLAAEITKKVIDSRRFGAATLDFCDVAAGRAEIFVEYSLCPWDLAAGSLIASEAGAIVSDMEGKPLQFEKKTSLIACNPQCYQTVMDIIKTIG